MDIKYRTELGKLLEYYKLLGHAAEIGVAEGRNASMLISIPAITKLYLIDAWTKLNQKGDGGNSQEWHEFNYLDAQHRINATGFKDKAVFLKGMSTEMIKKIPDDSLVLAYIDCDHSYSGCYRDLESVYQKVKFGGIVAGHDYLNFSYGVNKAVNTFVRFLNPNPKIHVIEEDEQAMASFWFRKYK